MPPTRCDFGTRHKCKGILLTKGLIFGMDFPLSLFVFTHNEVRIKKGSDFDQEIPQSHTADQPIAT